MNKFDQKYQQIVEEYQINEVLINSQDKETILPTFISVALTGGKIDNYVSQIVDFLDLTKPPKIDYDDANLSDNDKQLLGETKRITKMVHYIENSDEFFELIVVNSNLKGILNVGKKKKIIKQLNKVIANNGKNSIYYEIKLNAKDINAEEIIDKILRKIYDKYGSNKINSPRLQKG